jgi:hypothetical protein
MDYLAAVIFGLALLHTFMVKRFEHWAHRYPAQASVFHLLGEVEVVFGLWALVLIVLMAGVKGGAPALHYLESRQYTEPMFVFVIMVMAASRPILDGVSRLLRLLAAGLPLPATMATSWLGLAFLPLLGSVITEPAAMTLAALVLAPLAFHPAMPERLKYLALGVLLVNVSIGGTLTSFAAPPVLMVASTWQWSTYFMLTTFGWKAALAVLVNATAVVFLMRRHLHARPDTRQNTPAPQERPQVPLALTLVHAALLVAVVVLAHHPVAFMGVFLLFLGIAQAYARYQNPLIFKEALLVAFFLAGLVVVGGMQQWWLEPLVSGMSAQVLFLGAVGLTAVTDNAALTYLGSQIPNLPAVSQYSLVAGAVAGGGLTVIANAPNPAGVALVRHGFREGSVGPLDLLLAALPPTLVAAAAFWYL